MKEYSARETATLLGIAMNTLRQHRIRYGLGRIEETPRGPVAYYSDRDIEFLRSIKGRPGPKPRCEE